MRLVPFFVKLSYQIGIAGFRERWVGDLTLQSEISDVFRALHQESSSRNVLAQNYGTRNPQGIFDGERQLQAQIHIYTVK